MCGKKSLRGCSISKYLTRGIVLLLLVSLCVVIYWWILVPIILRLFIPEGCVYQGVEYYTEENYLYFEDGFVFRTMLSDFGVLEQGEIIDFYYVDNYTEDNPIHGKMSDIYALDILYQEEVYLEEKKHYEEGELKPIGDYTFFAMVDTFKERSFVKGVAFCDETCVIRYVLVTDMDTLFLISNVFSRHSNLNWSKG